MATIRHTPKLSSMIRTEKANPNHPPFVLVDPADQHLIDLWVRKGYVLGECEAPAPQDFVDFNHIPLGALRILAAERGIEFNVETPKSELADALTELSWDDDPPQTDESDEPNGEEDEPAPSPVRPQRPMSRSQKRSARNGG